MIFLGEIKVFLKGILGENKDIFLCRNKRKIMKEKLDVDVNEPRQCQMKKIEKRWKGSSVQSCKEHTFVPLAMTMTRMRLFSCVQFKNLFGLLKMERHKQK